MWLLQNALRVVGSTALGVVLGFSAAVYLVAWGQKPGGEPWQAGMGQYFGGLFIGAPLGGLFGLALGVARMRREVWGPLVWAGILAGLAAGPFVSQALNVHVWAGWWGDAVVAVACGAQGGAAGAAVETFRRESSGPRNRRLR
ncbi:hypothetical protein [Paludisphaera mucosa]|uniref:Uncharacterized protein n=1 Tax=Paludisphaera mucosa TaxID=3030827 RepID=A0ABT6FJA8_9BACT|nr:hypothetical protein [Paludisphaera mucosa]MDG3007668.1 hypothetical protein [Paludisphaera mucosa]